MFAGERSIRQSVVPEVVSSGMEDIIRTSNARALATAESRY